MEHSTKTFKHITSKLKLQVATEHHGEKLDVATKIVKFYKYKILKMSKSPDVYLQRFGIQFH